MYPVALEGERLWLREFDPADAPAVQRWTGDVAVVQYVPLGPTDDDGAAQYVRGLVAESRVEERTAYTLGLVERETGDLVGAVALTIDSRRHRRAELGYLVRRDRWGQGYATEAAALMVGFGFADLGLHRLWAVCDPANHQSVRVLVKLGMHREGLMRHDLLVGDEWRDSELYAVLADGWTADSTYI